LPKDAWAVDPTWLMTFDLRSATLAEDDLDALQQYEGLVALHLPQRGPCAVELASFPLLQTLDAPARCLRTMDEWRAPYVTLHDPGDFSQIDADTAIVSLRDLTVKGRVTSLSRMPELFPALSRLTIDEGALRVVGASFPRMPRTIALRVRSVGPPTLDWLNSVSAEQIIEFSTAPTEATRKLELLTRAWVPADGLRPQVLAGARSLEWLVLLVEHKQTAEWYADVADLLRTGLPALRTFELVNPRGGDPLSASSRDEAIRLAERGRADPGLIGSDPEEDEKSN
jgi:hypothetical protein